MNCPLCKSTSPPLFFQKEEKRSGRKDYFQCLECHLIFLSPEFHPTIEREKEVYSGHENSPENEGYVEHLRKLADPLTERLPKGFSGLDYGSGPGPTMCSIFEQKGFKVENYDPLFSPENDLLEKSYDFVTCTEVAEHFHYPRDQFLRLEKLFHNFLGIMTQVVTSEIEFKNWWYHRDPTHVCFYSKETLDWIADWRSWKIEYFKENVVIYSKTPLD